MRLRADPNGRLPPPPPGALGWPVFECRVSSGWEDPQGLTCVTVARRSPERSVLAAVFLLDRACLGAKNAFATHATEAAYRGLLRNVYPLGSEVVALPLAGKIVRESMRYAESLGFSPHRDAPPLLPHLGPVVPCDVPVRVGGQDGRPFYVEGPDDDSPRILRTLTRRFGPDGFRFIVSSSPGLRSLGDLSDPPRHGRDPGAWF